MPHKLTPSDLIFGQSSLFLQVTTQIEEQLQYQDSLIENQLVFFGRSVLVQLYSQILKFTFLTPQDEKQSVPLFLKLNYDIKATYLICHQDISRNTIKGFSLFKNTILSYDFQCHDEKTTNQWIDQLSKQIFLSGFSNHFKSIKYIGRGQFAQVWQMQRLRDNKRFAVKIIDKQTCFGQVKGKEAVYNEIQILKKLNHDNIEHLQCIYQSQKNLYLVLQYVPGFVLSDLVRKKKSSSQSASSDKLEKIHKINIMKNLLKTIKYLHDHGIAHRDIKPGNIIINPANNWKPYLIDFGLSEFTSKEQFLFQCCGSPGYMAPQIFADQGFLDLQKCDIFSLGAIFYLLLTHQPLFDGNSTQEIYKQTKDSKNFIKKKLKALNSQAEVNLISEMLHQNPQKRLTADQALSHDYFIEASYDYLNQIRKPSSEGQKTISFSVKQRKIKSRFQELFSQSAIFMGFKLNLIKQENKQNTNTSQSTSFNMVEPSQEFIQKISRRSSRFMSEENIDVNVNMKKGKIQQKQDWSGKWKNFKVFNRVLMQDDIWEYKDFNACS